MRKHIIISILLLFCAGCGRPTVKLYNLNPDRLFYLPAGTLIDWRNVPDKDLPNDLKQYAKRILDVDPNAAELETKTRILQYRGPFICDELMDIINTKVTEENLTLTLTEKIFKKVGL